MFIIARQPIGTERSEKTAFTIDGDLVQVMSTDIDSPRMVALTVNGSHVTLRVGDFLPYKGGRIHILYVSARCVKFGLEFPESIRILRSDYKQKA